MTRRAHNFSAGPAALPLEVLEKAQAELVDFRGTGMSIMEQSHRDKPYEAVHAETQANIKALLGMSDDYQVLFMAGGARTQFAFVPLNLLPKDEFAEYVTTGVWAEGALSEGKKIGDVREIWSSATSNHNHVPAEGALKPDPKAAYLHYTSNNTIYGTQYQYVPDSGQAPVVCDMSSDFLSKPVDVSKFGLIYAGAQKNVGPSGVTILIIRKDLLERSAKTLPEMFSYAVTAKNDSLYNTPPVFPIYMCSLTTAYLLKQGGLDVIAKSNERKAKLLYDCFDASSGFYRGHATPGSRSLMNVTFRLPTEELETRFVKESAAAELVGLKGHRLVGGLRASIYNAVPEKSVAVLVDFMKDFHKRAG
ncbi:MAG: 3-phosphoserine/phosphohydroxythreonine transaminase [Clostridia bacterium]|nr:3-phosphoserine/phosphohydroxythreonine transaminase [Deltaproteobacteria bacterium]